MPIWQWSPGPDFEPGHDAAYGGGSPHVLSTRAPLAFSIGIDRGSTATERFFSRCWHRHPWLILWPKYSRRNYLRLQSLIITGRAMVKADHGTAVDAGVSSASSSGSRECRMRNSTSRPKIPQGVWKKVYFHHFGCRLRWAVPSRRVISDVPGANLSAGSTVTATASFAGVPASSTCSSACWTGRKARHYPPWSLRRYRRVTEQVGTARLRTRDARPLRQGDSRCCGRGTEMTDRMPSVPR